LFWIVILAKIRPKFVKKVAKTVAKPNNLHLGENVTKRSQKMLSFLWATSSFENVTISIQKKPNWQKIAQSGHPVPMKKIVWQGNTKGGSITVSLYH
jgi:hypothetical protein